MQPMFTLPFHNSGFKFSYMLRSFIPRFLMTAAVVGSSVSLLSARSASAAPPRTTPLLVRRGRGRSHHGMHNWYAV